MGGISLDNYNPALKKGDSGISKILNLTRTLNLFEGREEV